jgi:hypothetical protein
MKEKKERLQQKEEGRCRRLIFHQKQPLR